MSKSMFNVVNPDDIVEHYGADTLRLYEMFLGPLEQSKPWDTNGIDGVHKFLRRAWRLFHNQEGELCVSDGEPTSAEMKVLHRTGQKISDDIERFSFNTCVSQFMICANDLTDLKCNKRAVLEAFTILLAPFAPIWPRSCGFNWVMAVLCVMRNGLFSMQNIWRKAPLPILCHSMARPFHLGITS